MVMLSDELVPRSLVHPTLAGRLTFNARTIVTSFVPDAVAHPSVMC
jgi:hypothetical protein